MRGFVVLTLEAVSTSNTAALRIEHGEVNTWNHLEQLGAVEHPAHTLHVTCAVVSHALLIVGAESELNLAFIEELVEESGGQSHAFAHVG